MGTNWEHCYHSLTNLLYHNFNKQSMFFYCHQHVDKYLINAIPLLVLFQKIDASFHISYH